jgi:hypothetical protein
MTGDEGQVRAKRDAAALARRLSLGVADDVTRNRMLAFAASLDAEADGGVNGHAITAPGDDPNADADAAGAARNAPKG